MSTIATIPPTAAPQTEPQPLAVNSFGAARLLGVSESHWRGLLAAGRCPAGNRLGRRRVWAVDELRRWLDAGCPCADRWQAMQK